MSDEDQADYYKDRHFTGIGLDDSYIPTKTLRVLPLIKKHFHKLYYTTQHGWSFNWSTFFGEVLNGMIISVLLGYIGFNVYSGDTILGHDGHTADFWMMSFGLYGALLYTADAVLIARTNQISLTLIAFIFVLSLIPFWLLLFLYDTTVDAENSRQWVQINLFQSCQYYLFAFALVSASLLIEICKRFYGMYWKPNLSEYFQYLIKTGQQDDPTKFEDAILETYRSNHNPIQRRRAQETQVRQIENELAKLGANPADEDADQMSPGLPPAKTENNTRASTAIHQSNIEVNTSQNSHRLHMMDHPSQAGSQKNLLSFDAGPVLSEQREADRPHENPNNYRLQSNNFVNDLEIELPIRNDTPKENTKFEDTPFLQIDTPLPERRHP